MTIKKNLAYCSKRVVKNEDEMLEMQDSFYINDIRTILEQVKSSDTINKYINAFYNKDKKKKIDSDINEIKKWLSPDRYPDGKWPSVYSPSLMQQVAINIAISEKDRNEKIFSVNGPPGTGKTTLLKEVIASNIVKRAIELTKTDPEGLESVTNDGKIESYFREFFKMPESISKYGILVASNNNAAVENISLELPKAEDVVKGKTHTGLFDIEGGQDIFFTEMANELNSSDSWGTISARMGRSRNIKDVANIIKPYVKASIIKKLGQNYDLNDYNKVVAEFNSVRSEVKNYKKNIELDIKQMEELKKLYNSLGALSVQLKETEGKEHLAKEDLENRQRKLMYNEQQTKRLEGQSEYIKSHATLIQRFLMLLGIGAYAKQIKELEKEITDLVLKHYNLEEEIHLSRNIYEKVEKELKDIQNKFASLAREYDKCKIHVDEIKKKYGSNYADDEFYKDIVNNEASQSACPWTTKEFDKLREKLFYLALQVHKGFILCSTGVKRNLNILSNYWNNDSFSKKQKETMFPHLLNTLSLLIPVMSTTFASVITFLKYIKKEELGTLIIDESGQATPQSALGAIWRSKTAIIVGDPLQVEPICTVPQPLIYMFQEKYGLAAEYADLSASVQSMADRVNEFNGEINETVVGCPLVIHRRCIEPMFSISNFISYGDRMFNQTNKRDEEHVNFDGYSLHHSKWYDIKGKEMSKDVVKDHYVEEQGNLVLDLFDAAVEKYGDVIFSKDQKKVYIISPFNSVVNRISKKLEEKYGDKFKEVNQQDNEDKNDSPNVYKILRNFVGTVHRFQGKEANEVFFVLGCDSETGMGAARWAGQKANVLNVACTRAKYRIAIIGDRDMWKKINFFDTAVNQLDDNDKLFAK